MAPRQCSDLNDNNRCVGACQTAIGGRCSFIICLRSSHDACTPLREVRCETTCTFNHCLPFVFALNGRDATRYIILSLHKATRRLALSIMKEFRYAEKEKGSFVYKVYLTRIGSRMLDVIHDNDLKSVSMGRSIFNLQKQSTSDADGKKRFIRSRYATSMTRRSGFKQE